MIGYDSICCFRSLGTSEVKRVLWEITTRCNLNCSYCHRTATPNCEPTLYEINHILSILKYVGIKKIIISGGEPFYRSDISQIIVKIIELGFEIDICTNATLLNKEKIHGISPYLSEISVSIDSCCPTIHDDLRGKTGSWKSTISGIKLLKKAGMEIHTISLLTLSNIYSVEKTVDFLKSLGVHSCSFIGHIPVGVGKNPFLNIEVQEDLKRIFNSIRTRNPEFPVNTKQLILNDGNQICYAGKQIFGISAENYIFPCILRRRAGGINLLTNKKEDILKLIMDNSTWTRNKVILGEGICPGSLYLNGVSNET